MIDTTARVAAAVRDAYDGRDRDDRTPGFDLESAIDKWVGKLVLNTWDTSMVCDCEDCPARPAWHRDLDDVFEMVSPLVVKLERIARRDITKSLSAFVAAHPEAPWAMDPTSEVQR